MNTIFLTSQASEVLEKIVPFLPKKPEELRVVFIPTAGNPYLPNTPWLEQDRSKLVELGFSVNDFDLEGKNMEETKVAIDNADIIFVGGGNTFYLLDRAKESGFIEAVRDAVAQGKIYIGSSAGSALASPDIKYVELFDEPTPQSLQDTTALSLVKFRILPHFDNPRYAELHAKVLADYDSEDSPLKPAKDTEFILSNGDTWGIGVPEKF